MNEYTFPVGVSECLWYNSARQPLEVVVDHVFATSSLGDNHPINIFMMLIKKPHSASLGVLDAANHQLTELNLNICAN